MSKNYNVIYIDLSTGQQFYSDRVIQNGVQIYKCEQTSNASVWVLNHGLNTNKFILKITDTQNNIIEPLSVVVTSLNAITISFSKPTSGNVTLVLFDLSQSDVTPTPTPHLPCDLTYNETILTKTPIAYWSFDSNFTDSIENNILTPIGTNNSISLLPDSYGNTLEFLAGSQGTTMSQPITCSGEFSLEVWIHMDETTPEWSTIFGTDVYGFQINHESSPVESYTLYLYGNNDGIQFSTISPNTTYHLVLTKDSSGNTICYANTIPTVGNSISTDTYIFQHLGSDIGDGSSSYYLGLLGNPTIYDHVLTSEQILENYNSGINCYRYTTSPVPTPSITPTITVTPIATNTPTPTPSITPTISVSPTSAPFVLSENLFKMHSDTTVDTTFSTITYDTYGAMNTMIEANDGRIYFGGGFFTLNGITYRGMARLNSDGTFDDAYINQDSTLNQSVYKIIQTNDGKIYSGGTSYVYTTFSTNTPRLHRFNSDGTLDVGFSTLTFSPRASVGYLISSLLETVDGKIYVGGNYSSVNGNIYNGLSRLNSDGTLDTTFVDLNYDNNNNNNDIIFYNMIQTADNKIYLISSDGVIRLNSDGTLDITFSKPSTTGGIISDMKQASDGNIYMVGSFITINNISFNYIARLLSDGTLDSSYIISLSNSSPPSSLIQLQSNKILLFGPNSLSLLNSDGTIDAGYVDPFGIRRHILNASMQTVDGAIYCGGGN